MFAVLGILVSLALLITLAYRGWNVILLAPICALVAAILSIGDETAAAGDLHAGLHAGAGQYLAELLPAVPARRRLRQADGRHRLGRAIARRSWYGPARAGDAGGRARVRLLTYGGVSLFVVAFAVFPIAARCSARPTARAPHPRRDCARLVHVHDDRPAGHARDPEPDPHAPSSAPTRSPRPGLRLIAAPIMFGGGMRGSPGAPAGRGGRGGIRGATRPARRGARCSRRPAPSFAVAIRPSVVVIGLNFVVATS